MKFFATIVLLALVAVACAGKLPAVEQPELKPESEVAAEPEAASADLQARGKRGLLYSYGAYASPYASAYGYPVAAYSGYSAPAISYSSPLAYSAYSAYRPAYYPSYYSSYVLG